MINTNNNFLCILLQNCCARRKKLTFPNINSSLILPEKITQKGPVCKLVI